MKKIEHDEIFEDTWENQKDDGVDYAKIDVLSTTFDYSRCSEGMEEITGFGIKNN